MPTIAGCIRRESLLGTCGAISCTSERPRHEDTERIVHVPVERPAPRKTRALVEAEGRRERRGGPSLKPEAAHTPCARFPHHMLEDRAPDAASEERVGDAHRLDLPSFGVELLERAAPRELFADPRRPEGH